MNWERHKGNVLDKDDKSFKGSVDFPVRELVEIVNESADFLTTSTCSGRIMLINETSKVKRKNDSEFLFVSHDYVQGNDIQIINDCLQKATGNVFFKLEPLIVHVQCRSLGHATWLLHLMKHQNYFKHSCIVSASNDKFIVSIKAMVKLEIPLVFEDEKIVDDALLTKYIQIANTRMVENFKAIDALTGFLREGHLLEPHLDQSEKIDFRLMRPRAIMGKPSSVAIWSLSQLTVSDRVFSLDSAGRFLIECGSNQRIGIKPEADGSRPSLSHSALIRPLKDCILVADDEGIWALCWSARKPKLLDFFWLRVDAGHEEDFMFIEEVEWIPIEIPTTPQFNGPYEKYGKILVVSEKDDEFGQDVWRRLCKSKNCTAVICRSSLTDPFKILFSSDVDLIADFKHNGVRYKIDFSMYTFTPSGARDKLVSELVQNESIIEVCDSPNCVGIHVLAKSSRVAKYTFVVTDECAAQAIRECLSLNNVGEDKFEILTSYQVSSLDEHAVSRLVINTKSLDVATRWLDHLRPNITAKIQYVFGPLDRIPKGFKVSKKLAHGIVELERDDS